MNCRTEYEIRLRARQQAFDQLQADDDRAVRFRMAAFLLGLACAWAVFGRWQFPGILLIAPIGLFVAAVIYHTGVRRRRRSADRAIKYYRSCLQRIAGEWSDQEPWGDEFLSSEHPYAGDLDIFGKGSLFQLLGSPVTPFGARTLATWLAPRLEDPSPTIRAVRARQAAVRSLRDQLDLRERLAIIGRGARAHDGAEQLHQWLSHPSGLTGPWIRIVAAVLGLLGLGAVGLWAATRSPSALMLIVLLEYGFLRWLREPLDSIKQHSEHATAELHRIKNVVAALESIESDDAELCRLRGELMHHGLPTSEIIHRLERRVSQFENMRHNLFIAPLAFVSMLSFHFACTIDLWRARHGTHVDRWFQAIGELEALLALARLHFENPAYCFPTLVDGSPRFTATQLTHPLLGPDAAVCNDVDLSDTCRMLLVSGSNMSGKSTMLRSVGINTVLAWAGGPVCAQSLEISRLQVAAAMRVQDSLQTGTSHFMAELRRIRLVVELAQRSRHGAPTVLALLDEILHGTNSHDRLVGARGVIRSLLDVGALCLVTTHDLALSAMVAELEAAARTVHFRDQWLDGKMTFDYQMRDGVVPKGNALSLMRLLGLDV